MEMGISSFALDQVSVFEDMIGQLDHRIQV